MERFELTDIDFKKVKTKRDMIRIITTLELRIEAPRKITPEQRKAIKRFLK